MSPSIAIADDSAKLLTPTSASRPGKEQGDDGSSSSSISLTTEGYKSHPQSYNLTLQDRNVPPLSPDDVTPPSTSRHRLVGLSVIAACFLAVIIVILYLLYPFTVFLDIFKISPPSQTTSIPNPQLNVVQVIPHMKSDWSVEYDIPVGIPLVVRFASELKDLVPITCPPRKFALVLHLDSDAKLAENWLRNCADKVAYFRIIGNPTQADVDKLKSHVKYAQSLSLKATLRSEKGAELIDNGEFQDTRIFEDIKSVEISGYITPKMIEELVDAVPYIEELAIKGGEVCSSLRRSVTASNEAYCNVNWQFLQKLHMFDTQECRELYDLISSCWTMPQIKVLQIRNSVINGSIAEYIKVILDRHRIMKVDFADNSCFDEAMQTYPFMCQASSDRDR